VVGRRVVIDHGMGIVIGETATVGDGCLLYKGVVPGGPTLPPAVEPPGRGTAARPPVGGPAQGAKRRVILEQYEAAVRAIVGPSRQIKGRWPPAAQGEPRGRRPGRRPRFPPRREAAPPGWGMRPGAFSAPKRSPIWSMPSPAKMWPRG